MKRSEGAALRTDKRTRCTAMMVVDEVFSALEDALHFRIDPGAESHRLLRADAVDRVVSVLEGKVKP